MKLFNILLLTFFLGVPAFAERTHEISLGGEAGTLDRDYYYNFGPVRIFDEERATFFLRNTGRIPIYINDIDLRGANVFSGGDNCPRILFQGDRCRIRVVFEPRRLMVYRANLEINLTPAEDITIHLRGRGVLW